MRRLLGALFVLVMMISPAFAQQPKAAINPAQREFSAKQPQISTEIITPQGRVRLSPEEAEKLRTQLNQAFEQSPQSHMSPEIVTPEGPIRLSPEMTQKLRAQLNYAFEVATIPANVCYTMHSFVFKRYNGGDATRLVKQTTCTPAGQFRVKRSTVTKSR